MWFNILLHNHQNFDGPIVKYLRSSLSLSGHEVTVSWDNIYENAINIYIEHFMDGAEWGRYFDLLNGNNKIKVGVVTTELMVGGVIPYGRHGIPYTPESLSMRVKGFYDIAPKVDFVWSLLDRTAQDLVGKTKFSEHYPYGSISLVDAEQRRSPKDVDVFFFGKITPHRKAVLSDFLKKGVKFVAVGNGFPMGKVGESVLDSLIDRSKICLNLTLHDKNETEGGVDPRFVSCDRITRMLERGAFVVSEDIPLDNPYAPYMLTVSADQLADRCRELLAGNSTQEIGEEMASAFHRDMNARILCPPVVARTLKALGL